MQLILQNIKKSFESKSVLKGVDFTFEQGKIYGLLGRNGSGKTTLFNCISGELETDAGQALLRREGETKLVTGEELSFVYATPVLPNFLTGYEFIKFFIDINRDRIPNPKPIDFYFDLIKFDKEDRTRLIKGYSHGMQNKIQMLCFLIARPPIILLDEPLTSFDVVVALEIKKMLREIKSEHIIIFSTHILQLASDLCDEIVLLNDGKLEQVDHETLRSSHFEEKVIELLKDEEND